MELVITSQGLESPPNQNKDLINKPSGFLTSSYKKVARANFSKVNSSSLFGIRQRIKSRQLNTISSIDTILKLSLFLAVLFTAIG